MTNPIGIIGAMPQEVELLIANLDNKQVTKIANFNLYHGVINNVPVVVMQSGIGKVNATIATTLLIEKFNPKAIINTGSAGGLGDNLAVGDVVIGTNVAHHDVDVTVFGYKIGQMAQMPIDYPCDKGLIEVAQNASKQVNSNKTIHQGLIVSGDQFIASSEQFAKIKQNFPLVLAVEMEACAIAQTCYQFNVPFVVIRAISDLANEQASVSFDEFIELAGKQSAEMVVRLVEKL
ncbi:MAG: 5'-methylthioadenosine/adenosylhomocysteine nucleosidase [Moraxellaceae bacterium]|nr:5'-methylthioadenosine/adenosylhomocysteine nucleosidase [Moraxellaceae bacterium]